MALRPRFQAAAEVCRFRSTRNCALRAPTEERSSFRLADASSSALKKAGGKLACNFDHSASITASGALFILDSTAFICSWAWLLVAAPLAVISSMPLAKRMACQPASSSKLMVPARARRRIPSSDFLRAISRGPLGLDSPGYGPEAAGNLTLAKGLHLQVPGWPS